MNQGGLRAVAIALMLLGVVLGLLGLVFLLASGKAVKGGILLEISGVMIGVGASSPEVHGTL